MPRQLDKIRMYNEYKNHPLREEYETRLSEISTNEGKSLLYYVIIICVIAIWIIPIGFVFAAIIESLSLTYTIFDWLGLIVIIAPVFIIDGFISIKLLELKDRVQQKTIYKKTERIIFKKRSIGVYI